MESKDKNTLMFAAYYDHAVVAINDINDGVDPTIVLNYLREYTALYNDEIKRLYKRFITNLKIHTENQKHISKESIMEELDDLCDTLLAQLDSHMHR